MTKRVVTEELRLVSYADARRAKRIKDGDTLLFAPRIRWWMPIDWLTLLICWAAGNGHWYQPWTWLNMARHCHAAKAVWWLGQLMCVQETSIEPHFLALSELVRRWPGKIDVYRPSFKSDEDRQRCVWMMVRIARRPYGWFNLIRVALHHLPIVWRLLPKDSDDWESSRWPPFCSMAVSMADRYGDLDPCPHKSDRLTEPGDLAESKRYRYIGTLT